ncbi:MAG: hypothetical protein JHC33_07230 [Ignisphaera sp.]|nr:hypothetical protein [Ignisphaera sp.]
MRGESTVIVVTIFIAIFIAAVLPFTLYIYTMYGAVPSSDASNKLFSATQLMLASITRDINATGVVDDEGVLHLYIYSRTGERVEIDKVLLRVSEGTYVVLSNISRYVEPGKFVYIPVNLKTYGYIAEPILVYIITRRGVVVPAKIISLTTQQNVQTPQQLEQPPTPKIFQLIPIKVTEGENIWNLTILTQKGFKIATLDNPVNPTKVVNLSISDQIALASSLGMSGGTSPNYVWSLDRVFSNVRIAIYDQYINNLWIGYNPLNTSTYNIMITSDSLTIAIDSNQMDLCSLGPVRVKIYGFRSSRPEGILQLGGEWLQTPNQDIAAYTFSYSNLYLDGEASRVEVYCRIMSSETGYNPYTLLMNTDGSNGYASILFTTIDEIWGWYFNRNDGYDMLLDYSTNSFALVYTQLVISNKNYSNVIITLNYRFHDNEGSDEEGITHDYPIMFVGLVDDKGNIYSYRSYTFRELTRYEDTYPPTAQAQSSVVFIPLPPPDVAGEKKFYVFIAFQDPYSYNGYLDDLDFTLYIENLSVALMTG